MTAHTFQCRLITPTARLLDEPVKYASVPAWDGLFGVLPNRAPLVAKLGLGELRLDFPDTPKAAGGSRSFLVEDGFVHMVDNRLTILASSALPVESISLTDAQAELAASEARSVPEDAPDRSAERRRLTRDRERARVKVRLAGGRRAI